MNIGNTKEIVQEKYGQAALRAKAGGASSCCGGAAVLEDARTFLVGEGLDVDALAKNVDGTLISAFIRATKPAAASCCGPSCCT